MSIKVITTPEARSWCERNHIATNGEGPDVLVGGIFRLRFSIPDETSGRILLSRILYPSTWEVDDQVLIWTTTWSVWASGEHMPLFLRLRESFGDRRSLHDANAQTVDPDSAPDGESILILNCLFLWDCWVLTESGRYAAFFSHDEWGEVYVRAQKTHERISEELRAMGVLVQTTE